VGFTDLLFLIPFARSAAHPLRGFWHNDAKSLPFLLRLIERLLGYSADEVIGKSITPHKILRELNATLSILTESKIGE
jgi:hypothetical protein